MSTPGGYKRFPPTGSRTGDEKDAKREMDSARPDSDKHRAHDQSSNWSYRLLIRWGCAFLISWIIIGTIYTRLYSRAPLKKSTGEFDECPMLLGVVPEYSYGSVEQNEHGEEQGWSKVMLPTDLMSMVQSGETLPRHIIHQSWKGREGLPVDFQMWSNEWRRLHGHNWIYVLWTDEDNRKLVTDYYPEYLEAYNGLPQELYRAYMARNMYMHRFGGIYANLDIVPLSPLHNHLPDLVQQADGDSHVYLSQAWDGQFAQWIPNSFMASSLPGNRFWLRPLELVQKRKRHPQYTLQPETLTGYTALTASARQWLAEEKAIHIPSKLSKIRLLGYDKIYPFSRPRVTPMRSCTCLLRSPWFNQTKCSTLNPDIWMVTAEEPQFRPDFIA